MSRVYSDALFSEYSFTGESATTTVPDDETWVARDIFLTLGSNLLPPLPYWWLGIGGSGGPPKLYLPQGANAIVENEYTFEWQGRIVLTPGTEFSYTIENATGDVLICGYRLASP
jgi:hypothetical protein